MTLEAVGRMLRDARTAAGLSQRDVAERVGVTHTYISHIEAGRRHPSVGLLANLAYAVGCRLAISFEARKR